MPDRPQQAIPVAKERGLTVEIRDGRLVIEIGLGALATATTHCPRLERWDADKGYQLPIITDPEVWAKAVLHELRAEEEDGTTRVHRMLDEAMEEAVEQGAEGIKMPGDEE